MGKGHLQIRAAFLRIAVYEQFLDRSVTVITAGACAIVYIDGGGQVACSPEVKEGSVDRTSIV
jgi:hypothetical protein